MIGKYARRPAAEAELSAMLDALAPRAPDAATTWTAPDGAARLGFRWLRTQPSEHNPAWWSLPTATSRCVRRPRVCRRRQAGPGAAARAVRGQGARGLARLDAQFGLAIWDARRGRLSLARDPLGVRFVYYWSSADGAIFASEIKALLRHPAVTRGFDEIALVQYLVFLTSPGPRTLFAGVRRVPAGGVVELSVTARPARRRWWDLLDDAVDERDDEAYYVNRTRELHQAAVRRRSVEGPIGALCSGGNDSSSNVVLLSRQGANPLHTFTVGLASSRATQVQRPVLRAPGRRVRQEPAPRVAAVDRRVHQPGARRPSRPGRPGVRAVERVLCHGCAWPRTRRAGRVTGEATTSCAAATAAWSRSATATRRAGSR